MIITDRLVFIHAPKTGGTFVTRALTELYHDRAISPLRRGLRRLIGRSEYLIDTAGAGTKHGGCSDIPPEHRGKPVISIVRNPYDRYVSDYYFRWWDTRAAQVFGKNLDELRAAYPHFPAIGFAEFLAIRDRFSGALGRLRNPSVSVADDHGWSSARFVAAFFKDPAAVYPKIDDHYLAAGAYRHDMHVVHFLRTESLNRDLYEALLRLGYPARRLRFILEWGRILPPEEKGRRPHYQWEKEYTPELLAWVRRKERILFTIFPEFDIVPDDRKSAA
jgi:hypothetical protein